SAIVMSFDSPGGSVFGVLELASVIRKVSEQKTMVAVVNSQAADAAYVLAASTGTVIITPGGSVGDLGVIAAHVDASKAQENAGVKTTLITSSKYKAEGHPYGPLGEEAYQYVQEMVNAYGDLLTKAIADGLGVTPAKVARDFGQGRMLLAED